MLFDRVLDTGELERVNAVSTSHGWLAVHGLTPALGRGFTADDTRPGAPPVVMLGYGESELSVTVRAGQTAMAVFALESRAVELDAVTVEAAIQRGSSVAVIAERRNATQVVDAIGAEQISRSSDGDAAKGNGAPV